jgi:hypothetical protein
MFRQQRKPRVTEHRELGSFGGYDRADIVREAMLHQPWSEGVASLEVSNPIFEVRYSCRKLSTGCSWAARMAGTVPNKIPTSALAAIAMIADTPEIGIR